MKLRVISDLHIDINHKIPLEYDDDVFTVVCGDISGYAEDSIQWIAKNVRNGVFVSGNHIAYSGQYTIEESQRELERVLFAIRADMRQWGKSTLHGTGT